MKIIGFIVGLILNISLIKSGCGSAAALGVGLGVWGAIAAHDPLDISYTPPRRRSKL